MKDAIVSTKLYDDTDSKFRYNPEQLNAIARKTPEGQIYKHSQTGDVFLKSEGILVLVDTAEGIPNCRSMTTSIPQEIVLIRDGSTSMMGQPVSLVNKASNRLLQILREINRIKLGVIDFNNDARVVVNLAEIGTIKSIPNLHSTGGTYFAPALNCAFDTITKTEKRKSVVVMYSDGLPGDEIEALEISNKIKRFATLLTMQFGEGDWSKQLYQCSSNVLLKMATSPKHFYKFENFNRFAEFLSKLGKVVVNCVKKNQDPCQALALLSDK